MKETPRGCYKLLKKGRASFNSGGSCVLKRYVEMESCSKDCPLYIDSGKYFYCYYNGIPGRKDFMKYLVGKFPSILLEEE